MAAERLSGRLIRAALVGVPLLIAGVVCAGPARRRGFLSHPLAQHRHPGPRWRRPGAGADRLEDLEQLTWGAPPQQLQSLALQSSVQDLGPRGLTPRQADALIDYALVDLCPRA